MLMQNILVHTHTLIFLIKLLIFSVLEKKTRLLLLNSQILKRIFFFFKCTITVFVYLLNVVDECSVPIYAQLRKKINYKILTC